jgi:HlyD family secretion protein
MAKDKGFGVLGWLIMIAIIAALAGGGYWYWHKHDEKGPDYKTAPVTRGDLIQMVTATGQLNPKTNVDVGSQVSGIINKLYVDFNSTVTNGQVVAQLDPATYKAIVAGAAADLASAKAALELAKAEEERSDALYKSKIVAQSDYDSAVAAYHQAQAQVQLKQASLQQAQVNLDYTTIYAPVDGVVISRNVDVGQTVAASLSAPTLYMIANDLAKMQIDALVSEADIGGIDTNQRVNFSVDAFPARVFNGTVIQIRNAPQTNQNVITYDTVIDVNNSDLKLRPGMTANVSIITASRTNTLIVPNAALRFHPPEISAEKKENGGVETSSNSASGGHGKDHDGQAHAGGGKGKNGHTEHVTHTVYVLVKGLDGKPDTLKPLQVKTGISDGIDTQLLDGLNENDEVVVGENFTTPDASTSSPFGGRRF